MTIARADYRQAAAAADDRKPRVLHLCAGKLYGGVETMLATLASIGETVHGAHRFALCFEGRFSEELRSYGAHVTMLGNVRLSRPWTVVRARRALTKLLDDQQIDAVVCHECWPHVVFAPAARRRRRPIIFWNHDAHLRRSTLERLASHIRPDLVIANSRFTSAQARRLFPSSPCEVVYYPVREPRIGSRAEVRQRVRTVLGAPPEAVVIVTACRLERWKGQHLLIDGLARMADDPRWRCWIAGGPQRPHEQAYLDELKRRTVELRLTERVRFLGQRSDVPDLLAAADIHCQPNAGPEPFGIVFVEALYAGLPVVTTAMGGALDIITDDCGRLVQPDDPAALAAALSSLVSDADLRARLGRHGPARAAELCRPLQQSQRLLESIQAACAR